MLGQEHTLSQLKQENADLFGLVYGVFNRVNGCKFAERLKELRKNDLRAAYAALSAKADMCSEAKNEQ